MAVCAGTAGMLSLSTAKSGALIGVLISVTTIPAAANVGVAVAYQDWEAWRGSLGQLAINLAGILVAGTVTLLLQRVLYARRYERHRHDLRREAPWWPGGRSSERRPRTRNGPDASASGPDLAGMSASRTRSRSGSSRSRTGGPRRPAATPRQCRAQGLAGPAAAR